MEIAILRRELDDQRDAYKIREKERSDMLERLRQEIVKLNQDLTIARMK